MTINKRYAIFGFGDDFVTMEVVRGCSDGVVVVVTLGGSLVGVGVGMVVVVGGDVVVRS
jgi:hypothetical protein